MIVDVDTQTKPFLQQAQQALLQVPRMHNQLKTTNPKYKRKELMSVYCPTFPKAELILK